MSAERSTPTIPLWRERLGYFCYGGAFGGTVVYLIVVFLG